MSRFLLRQLIRESLHSPYPWADESNEDARELDSWITNRWGAGGIDADRGQDRILEDLVVNKFPGLVEYSRKWLIRHPPMDGNLHRGIRIPRERIEFVKKNGLKSRGQLSSWTDDMGTAYGFARPLGLLVGALISIPISVANEHMLYGLKAYAASKGWDTDIEELEEAEYVLKDFDIDPQFIKIIS